MTEPLSSVLTRVDQEMKLMTDSIGMARPRVEAVTAILAERKTTHGEFDENALVSQHLKDFIRSRAGYANLTAVQRESIDMICCKLSRIVSGKAATKDHWTDIAGYARLAEERA